MNRVRPPWTARSLRRAARRPSRIALAALVAVATLTTSSSPSTAMSVDGIAPIDFTEQGGPVPVAPNAIITDGGSFSDGYIQFSIDGATAEETLLLPEVATPDTTNGAVSVVDGAVFLGLGGTAKQIGTVHGTNDGQNGRPLRIDFSAALTNADFSGGLSANGDPVGWTVNRNLVMMDSLASKTQRRAVSTSGSGPYTMTGDGYSFVTDVNYSPSSHAAWGREGEERGLTNAGSFSASVTSYGGQAQALRLWFTGNCPRPNTTSYCSVFGPDAWSSPFEAKAGDDLAFDWAAANGGDDYEVYGFLVNAAGDHTELMYGRGRNQGWTTTAGTIPADGTYRFRFVSGSYDATGGFAIGASLYIDNARVLSSDASAAVAQAVMRMVHYDSSSQNPPATRTIRIEAESATESIPPVTSTATVELIDDPPTIAVMPTAASPTRSQSTRSPPSPAPSPPPIPRATRSRTVSSTASPKQ